MQITYIQGPTAQVNAQALGQMLKANGQWMVTIHNGRIVQYAKVEKPVMAEQEPPSVETLIENDGSKPDEDEKPALLVRRKTETT